MSITIYPNTEPGHVAFTDERGRQYIIELGLRPEVEQFADGAQPDETLVNRDFFLPDDGRLLVTGFEADGSGARVEAEGIPHDLTLSPTEIATIGAAMAAG